LERAERASTLDDLFGCTLERESKGGNFWVPEGEGTRSICGCRYANIEFNLFVNKRWSLRAAISAEGGQRFDSLPVVDWEWVRHLDHVVNSCRGTKDSEEVKRRLNQVERALLMRSNLKFARIGLAGSQGGKCWLMLDSLFPQPEESWLAQPA